MRSNPNSGKNILLLEPLMLTVNSLTQQFGNISRERKNLLKPVSDFIAQKTTAGKSVHLVFICTHNSRRSHISQIWAQAATYYYGFDNIYCYSGGTEATAFNARAVKAMRDVGFRIVKKSNGDNPVHEVYFSEHANPAIAFSKKYDAESNPKKNFAAIMTCSHADENCPVIIGMEKRISLPYDDPKDFDGTPLEEKMYNERVMEIGVEILYAFGEAERASSP
jgi:arsenate reductase (thioredoxin)